jgi:methionyl-tRNA formyltransferase
MKSLKVIFMGTPPFAVPALEELHHSHHKIQLVVTQPDRPKGRGRKLVMPPVKQRALDFDYPVYQTSSLRTSEAMARLEQLAPDILVVVAFGQILLPSVLALPRLGAINLHASLLPRYRGAAPIQWAVINGEKETGVTTMQMDADLDTGDILLMTKYPLDPTETAQSLHDRLAVIGAALLLKTLDGIAADTIQPIPQDDHLATYAPMLSKRDGHIDWDSSAAELDCFIRGMNPWPGAYTFLDQERYKIHAARPLPTATNEPPGTVLQSFPGELRIAAGQNVLEILNIQGPSGKRLAIEDFLRGCPLTPGMRFS